jgi:hypothetical protein
MHHSQHAPHSQASAVVGRHPVPAETIFDGTKLPLAVGPSPDHYRWYNLPFSVVFDQPEMRWSRSDLGGEDSLRRRLVLGLRRHLLRPSKSTTYTSALDYFDLLIYILRAHYDEIAFCTCD